VEIKKVWPVKNSKYTWVS